MGIIDYSGGFVIHVSSGVAGFTTAYWVITNYHIILFIPLKKKKFIVILERQLFFLQLLLWQAVIKKASFLYDPTNNYFS